VVVATGGDTAARQLVERLFARDATGRSVALCSDAFSEGLNLQGPPPSCTSTCRPRCAWWSSASGGWTG